MNIGTIINTSYTLTFTLGDIILILGAVASGVTIFDKIKKTHKNVLTPSKP